MRLTWLSLYNGLVRGLRGLGVEDVGVQVPVDVPLSVGELGIAFAGVGLSLHPSR
jgi:hypothetical protein